MGLSICTWPFCLCASTASHIPWFCSHILSLLIPERYSFISKRLFSQNLTEDCADGWLKNHCSAPSLLVMFIDALLASKTQLFFSRSKIYDSSSLFKFIQSFWSSSSPKFSDLKQNTGIVFVFSICLDLPLNKEL